MNSAQGGLSRTFVGGAAGSEKIGDGDSGDDADDRDDDQKFDQREAFLAFGSHAEFLFLKSFARAIGFRPKVEPRKARSVGVLKTTVVPSGIGVKKRKFRSFLIGILNLES